MNGKTSCEKTVENNKKFVVSILKEIDFRIKTGQDPNPSLIGNLELVDHYIRRRECSPKELGFSEKEWQKLLHRERVSKALVSLNNCRKGNFGHYSEDLKNYFYYARLLQLIEPHGEVLLEEISTTKEEINSLGIKSYFMKWLASQGNSFFCLIDKLSRFLAKHKISQETVESAVSEIEAPEDLKSVFTFFLKGRISL